MDASEVFLWWWMMPVCILIAAAANISGIGGAAVFGPIFLLVVPLLGPSYPPLTAQQAVATAVFVEIFGFSSGVIGYARRGLIDARLSSKVCLASIPASVLASLYVRLPLIGLKCLYCVVVLVLGTYMCWLSCAPEEARPQAAAGAECVDTEAASSNGSNNSSNDALVDLIPTPTSTANPLQPFDAVSRTSVTASGPTLAPVPAGYKRLTERFNGKTHTYPDVPITPVSLLLGAAGGLLTGLIGVGLGELTVPRLMYLQVNVEVATAASVLAVALTCVATAAVQINSLFHQSGMSAFPFSLIAWMVPGVVIGAQVGTRLSGRASKRRMQRAIGAFFVVIGLLFVGVVAHTEAESKS